MSSSSSSHSSASPPLETLIDPPDEARQERVRPLLVCPSSESLFLGEVAATRMKRPIAVNGLLDRPHAPGPLIHSLG